MHPQKFTDTIMRDLSTFGSFTFFSLLIIISVLLRNLDLTIKLLFGFIFTALIVILIRLIYFKNRPKKQEYTNSIEKIDASSFPSLHAARVFFLATVFGTESGILIFLLVIAGFVAYSRFYLRKHDGWDLLAGAILGIGTYGLTLLFW